MYIILSISILIMSYFIARFLMKKTSIDYAINFNSYMAILQYHMDKAYDIIHKDRILIYSVEATKPNEDQVLAAARDFSKLVIKFLGPRLENELAFIYGDKDTLVFNLVEYFSSKFEGDEIRNSAVSKMMQQDVNTQSAENVMSGILKNRS